jgi:hypothetical protein
MNIMNRKKRIISLVSAAVLAVATQSFTGKAYIKGVHVQMRSEDGKSYGEIRTNAHDRQIKYAWMLPHRLPDGQIDRTAAIMLENVHPGTNVFTVQGPGGLGLVYVVGSRNRDWLDSLTGGRAPGYEFRESWCPEGEGLFGQTHSVPPWPEHGEADNPPGSGRVDWDAACDDASDTKDTGAVRFSSHNCCVTVQGNRVAVQTGDIPADTEYGYNATANYWFLLAEGQSNPLPLTTRELEQNMPTVIVRRNNKGDMQQFTLPDGKYMLVRKVCYEQEWPRSPRAWGGPIAIPGEEPRSGWWPTKNRTFNDFEENTAFGPRGSYAIVYFNVGHLRQGA